MRAKLDEWLTPAPACPTEAEFEQQLVAQGILSTVPPPLTDVASYVEVVAAVARRQRGGALSTADAAAAIAPASRATPPYDYVLRDEESC
jgi:hypothetical protein